MSHGEGSDFDPYYMKPEEVLAQYSVEWTALRSSYKELQAELHQVQADLSQLDEKLSKGEITEHEHVKLYQEKWLKSTEMIQVKREVEARLYEIQKEIREANKKLKEMEAERRRKERIEQEKSNAMIEWMSLKQGFELIMSRRKEIHSAMDTLEIKRRNHEIGEEEYRKQHVGLIRKLAELRTVESDVKSRLSELLTIIRK